MTEPENPDWQPPPPPEHIPQAEPSQMSEVATIGNVFIEPGRVFEDLARKPRFILAAAIVIVVVSVFQIAFIKKVGMEEIVRSRIEASSRTRDMTAEQKNTIIEQQGGPVAKYITYGATPIVMISVFLIGGLIYWGGANAMGGNATFLRGVSVWVYASLPPALVFMIGNIIVLMLKSVDDIDLAHSQQGLLKANLGYFVDPAASPVLAALLSTFDVFAIWGWILAAIGLQKVAKISSTAAWTVVLLVGAIGVVAKVIGAMLF
jgi:hypothetical protein